MNKGGRAAVARSRSIDHQLDEERERRGKEVQILILGGPGAGKSTFLKQVRLHYGDRYPPNERRLFQDRILQNVATALVHLLEHMDTLDLKFENAETQKLAKEFRKKHPRVSLISLIKQFKEVDARAEEMCPEMTKAELTRHLSSIDIYKPEVPNAEDMQTLWADPAVQFCYTRRHKVEAEKLSGSSEYFLQHIGRICSSNYLANIQDILHIRWPTLGVQEQTFLVDNLLYRMVDVAGQRSLRKKWIHFFDNSTAVQFFVSLAGFDENMEEDPTTNSLLDSMQAFNEVSHNQFLDKTEFIIFFNKKDEFATKLKTTSLTVCFPHYKGPHTVDAGIKYVKEQFLQNKPSHKQMYTHACCAVDVPSMKELLLSVVESIIEINIRRSKAL